MSGSPIAVCRTHELGEAGAFFTQDVEGTPVLVTRDAAGAIRALVNICRHQGARLVNEKQGVTRSFTCILHGWSYDAEGNMGGGVLARLARDNPMLATLRTTNALTPLPCELRHGFVWVVPRPREAIDVAAFLGPLDLELAALEGHVVRERSESPFPPSLRLRDVVSKEEGARVLSDAMALVFRDDHVVQLTVGRRRAESDFGEGLAAEDVCTLERVILAAT